MFPTSAAQEPLMPDSPLVVENLSFRYRDRQGTAIRDISFEANPGEILLIAGASGCGKISPHRAFPSGKS
jgi:ABC-type multidrug transport system fused ATPase/permease subunit